VSTVTVPGAWRSPITAARVAVASGGLGALAVDDDAIYWLEGRPAEGGRSVLVRWRPDGGATDLTPPPWNVRTRVHEYGGGSFAVAGGVVCFSNLFDQRVYRLDAGAPPCPLTPKGAWRFADGVVDERRRALFCVGEDHGASPEPANCLVRIDVEGERPPAVVASGHDFYASPRLSRDGSRLAWIAWRHPDMPWDGTELWVAEVDAAGDLRGARRVAGGRDESVVEPLWVADGSVQFVSDRSGWWNLYRLDGAQVRPLCALDAEFARPPWLLGFAHHATLHDGTILCAFARDGTWRIGRLDPLGGTLEQLPVPYTDVSFLHAVPGGAVFVGASPTQAPAVVRLDVGTGSCRVLRHAAAEALDPAFVSEARPFSFPSEAGRTAHGLYYPPRNPAYEVPAGARPPLILRCHGGPTAAASATLDPALQFWTSRGFAVVDVDYAGSSGYGRAYRQLLRGAWGLADVEDCVQAARFAVAQGWADPDRLVVRGSSAGGFTVLCALAFHDVFAVGASYYGIGDLEALRAETHKFESHYDQSLIGPYPDRRDLYVARSPLHAVERIRRPVIFFQGLDDRVVPAGQANAMAAALQARGIRIELVTFAGEGHGFRRAETIARALEEELAFYRAVLRLPAEIP
jgi:dipeptidyl aminopeptidase/acylaminoacyl peptidase